MRQEAEKRLTDALQTLINEVGTVWTKIDGKKLMKRCNANTNMMTMFVKKGILEKKRDGLKFEYRIAPGFNIEDFQLGELPKIKKESKRKKSDTVSANPIDIKPSRLAKQSFNGMQLTAEDKIVLLKLARKGNETHIMEKLIDAL